MFNESSKGKWVYQFSIELSSNVRATSPSIILPCGIVLLQPEKNCNMAKYNRVTKNKQPPFITSNILGVCNGKSIKVTGFDGEVQKPVE